MLTRLAIINAIKKGEIVITPFNEDFLGTNSYDVRLGKKLLVYTSPELDCRKNNPTKEILIPEEGFVLQPNVLYLGSTMERTKTDFYIPEISGKSSLGRLGLDIHKTAGFGDIGFDGTWTLEMVVVHPLRIYAGMKIGQIQFDVPTGEIDLLYRDKKTCKYKEQMDPVASAMYKNFEEGFEGSD